MNMTNQWVLHYNPYVLTRYNCHINVEVYSRVKVIKYLYKFINKGHDRCAVYVESDDGEKAIDEIQIFQDAQWVSPSKVLWRIYEFNLSEMQPPVINLQLHLLRKHSGGTGKTYLYYALLANVRSRSLIALATATSSVATSIFPGGRTTHSRFEIPLQINESTMTNISKQSGATKLIRKSKVLAVVPKSSRAEIVNESLVKSYLWPLMEKIQFRDGIPEDYIIKEIFPNLHKNADCAKYVIEEAILSSRNDHMDNLNDKLISMFLGESKTFNSFDSAEDDTNNYYQEEYLNTLTPNGLPPHRY
ncbi:hypothetical protein H5410_051905 [Solanum commersonii]|uniref:ATP-dependent DNA helicase n=1 Tax=Solanum commersonii TaxID=4109 RepID=A0A9J5X230_SOLCO|nr:hypothetical protein H5410_051905 [Solanum commersonii]